jgi:competence protein ComEC
LIRLSGRVEILVDGGGSPFSDFDVGAAVVVPALQALDVDELEIVIASHADADHIEGLVSVIEQIPTKHLVVGQRAEGDEDYDALIASAKRTNVEVHHVSRGEILEIADARLTFLHPTFEVSPAVNDNSVAFVLSIAGEHQALFLGDASSTIEEELAIPDINVLMVAHHGSKTSTSPLLLTAAAPEQVVLSYGKNFYGHPHTEVLARLTASGAKIHHTYLEGAIRIPLY